MAVNKKSNWKKGWRRRRKKFRFQNALGYSLRRIFLRWSQSYNLLRNLQLQRRRWSKLERCFKVEENNFGSRTHSATRGFVIFLRCSQSYNILRNLQLQHRRWSKLERFFKEEENNFGSRTHSATRGVVFFYSAGVVTHDRRIISLCEKYILLYFRGFFSFFPGTGEDWTNFDEMFDR
jgi:hypothetical protein